MVSKKVKVLTLLALVAGVIVAFNYNAIMAALQGTDTGSQQPTPSQNSPLGVIMFLIVLVCAAPFLFIALNWVYHKFTMRAGTNLAGGLNMRKVLKPEVREKNARKCIDDHRFTDKHLMATDINDMRIIDIRPSPSRDDAVQWDMFVFSTDDHNPGWNPLIDNYGIPPEHLFYVFVNACTGEAYFRRFQAPVDADREFQRLYNVGIMANAKAGELEKTLGNKMLEGFGIAQGMQSYSSGQKADVEKKEGEKDEKK